MIDKKTNKINIKCIFIKFLKKFLKDLNDFKKINIHQKKIKNYDKIFLELILENYNNIDLINLKKFKKVQITIRNSKINKKIKFILSKKIKNFLFLNESDLTTLEKYFFFSYFKAKNYFIQNCNSKLFYNIHLFKNKNIDKLDLDFIDLTNNSCKNFKKININELLISNSDINNCNYIFQYSKNINLHHVNFKNNKLILKNKNSINSFGVKNLNAKIINTNFLEISKNDISNLEINKAYKCNIYLNNKNIDNIKIKNIEELFIFINDGTKIENLIKIFNNIKNYRKIFIYYFKDKMDYKEVIYLLNVILIMEKKGFDNININIKNLELNYKKRLHSFIYNFDINKEELFIDEILEKLLKIVNTKMLINEKIYLIEKLIKSKLLSLEKYNFLFFLNILNKLDSSFFHKKSKKTKILLSDI